MFLPRSISPRFLFAFWVCVFAGKATHADILSSIKGVNPQVLGELHAGLAGSSLDEAKAFLVKGDLASARTIVERTRQSFPNLPLTDLLIAGWLFDLNQPVAGLQIMENLAATMPPRRDIHIQFARIALAQSRLFDASMHISTAKSITSDSTETREYSMLLDRLLIELESLLAEKRGNWKDAEAGYQQLRTVVANSPAAVNGLARIAFAQDDIGKAETLLREAEALSIPNQPPAELVLASWFEGRVKDEETEAWFSKGLERENNEILRREYSRWLLRQNRPEDARKVATQVKPSEEMKLDFLAVVSLAELMLGNSVEAERLLLRVLETNPNNFGLTNNLIWALARSKGKEKLERAYQLAESNLRKNPLSIEAVATLAWTQLRLGKVSEATETLERPTSNRNLSRDAAYFLAKTKEAEGKAEESKKILDGAIRARGEFFHLKAANADFERLSQ
jgi:hypothetical protein